MKNLAFALATSTALISGAHASSGTEWRDECTNKNIIIQHQCVTYTRGLADGLRVWTYKDGPASGRACIPQQVITQQLVEIGLLFMKGNPKIRHLNRELLLAQAFIEAWPCTEDEPDELKK